jgi:hypothetical protein
MRIARVVRGGRPMHLICPHCQDLIERDEGTAVAEIVCPICGQTFRPS